jgi:hypothetical protein
VAGSQFTRLQVKTPAASRRDNPLAQDLTQEIVTAVVVAFMF